MDKKVWWKCSKCGNEWPAKIKKRVAGSGCEKCAHAIWGEKQQKKVYQFSNNGRLIRSYESAKEAANEIGISRASIQHVCTGVGKLKTAGGYFWSYYEDGRIEQNNNSKGKRRVSQYSVEGELIKEYENVKTAAKEVQLSEASIRQACNGTAGRKTAGGFIWRYVFV